MSEFDKIIGYKDEKRNERFAINISGNKSPVNVVSRLLLSETIDWIDTAIFDFCVAESIEVDERNSIYKSIDGVLYTKDCKTLVRYPPGRKESSFIIPHFVERIGCLAFSDCSYLESVQIPESVEIIEHFAFGGKNLREVVFLSKYNWILDCFCEPKIRRVGWISGDCLRNRKTAAKFLSRSFVYCEWALAKNISQTVYSWCENLDGGIDKKVALYVMEE